MLYLGVKAKLEVQNIVAGFTVPQSPNHSESEFVTAHPDV